MIFKPKLKDINLIEKILDQNKKNSPYIYIDYHICGYSDDKVELWCVYDNNEISAIIYRYGNSCQLLKIKNECNFDEICAFMREKCFTMITGDAGSIELLSTKMHGYHASYGIIMELYNNIKLITHENVNWATSDDCDEIAKLIKMDENIGGHYTQNELARQLKNRLINEGCRNAIIKIDKHIICHAATYAELKDFAVIGGVITHPDYRGKGYGAKVIIYLQNYLYNLGKDICLYCYNNKIMNWYQKLGWKVTTYCGKLEKNN